VAGKGIMMELKGFKKYRHKGRSFTPKVTIRKNGVLAFNAGAVRKYDLDLYEYAILFISEDERRVAVKFTNNAKETGLLGIQKRPGNFQISARSFFNLYDIDWSENRNYDFKWLKAEHTAIFRVKELPHESGRVHKVEGEC
jgi:hypothetical protein